MSQTRPQRAPFQVGNEYFCNKCQRYSSNFYSSYIKKEFRICAPCIQLQRHQQQEDPITKLRHKLYKHLHFKKHFTSAKNITNNDIRTILEINRTKPEDVHKITAPNIECSDWAMYRVLKAQHVAAI